MEKNKKVLHQDINGFSIPNFTDKFIMKKRVWKMKRRPKGMGCVAFLGTGRRKPYSGYFKEKVYWNIQK